MNTRRSRTLGLGLFLVLLALGACNRTVEAPDVGLSTLGSCEASDETELRQQLSLACSTIEVISDITLTGPLTLEHDVTIEGSGTGVTVRRDPEDSLEFRVIDVRPDATVTLRNLAITGGAVTVGVDYESDGYGGGIRNAGSLTIQNSTVSANHADYGGGIYNHLGTLVIEDSAIAGNHAHGYDIVGIGGGIYSEGGSLTITGSTISDNSADFVGGCAVFLGVATITDSTVSGNRALDVGGLVNVSGSLTLERSTVSGNEAVGFGGGIATATNPDPDEGQHTTILNSTISGNRVGTEPETSGDVGAYNGTPPAVGGAIYNLSGPLRIVFSTVTGNRADTACGGVYADGGFSNWYAARTEVKGSIIWGNTSGTGIASDLDVSEGNDNAFVSLGYNLIGAAGVNVLSTAFSQEGDQTGVLDAMISPLGRNDPGATETHELLPGSPALDAGTCTDHDLAIVTTDQRGVKRPQGGACDIGAFELEAATTFHATGFYEPVGVLSSVFVASGTAPTPGPETIWNVARGNSTIPLKFNLYPYDGGPEITSTSGIGFSQTTAACPSVSAGDDAVDFTTTGSTSLRYDTIAGQFIQNWKTPKVSRDTCYLVSVSFPDDSALYAFMRLRK
jgi:hypothetical protein